MMVYCVLYFDLWWMFLLGWLLATLVVGLV